MLYEDIIQSASKEYGIAPALIKAIIKVESNWDPKAKRYEAHLDDTSWGLMQILLGTARYVSNNPNLTAEQLVQPTVNILIGTKYLKDLNDKYKNLDDTIASYNAGRPVMKFNKYINQEYVDKVKKWLKVYQFSTTGAVLLPVIIIGSLMFVTLKSI